MSDSKPIRLDFAPMPVPKLEKDPSLVNLLEAIRARGGYRQGGDPIVSQLEAARQTTEWTGQPTEQQTLTIKRNAMLILECQIVGLLNLEQRTVRFVVPDNSLVPAVGSQKDVQLKQMVAAVLGEGWEVTCGVAGTIPGTVPANDSRTAKPRRSPPKRKGARRTKKARKRRK